MHQGRTNPQKLTVLTELGRNSKKSAWAPIFFLEVGSNFVQKFPTMKPKPGKIARLDFQCRGRDYSLTKFAHDHLGGVLKEKQTIALRAVFPFLAPYRCKHLTGHETKKPPIAFAFGGLFLFCRGLLDEVRTHFEGGIGYPF